MGKVAGKTWKHWDYEIMKSLMQWATFIKRI